MNSKELFRDVKALAPGAVLSGAAVIAPFYLLRGFFAFHPLLHWLYFAAAFTFWWCAINLHLTSRRTRRLTDRRIGDAVWRVLPFAVGILLPGIIAAAYYWQQPDLILRSGAVFFVGASGFSTVAITKVVFKILLHLVFMAHNLVCELAYSLIQNPGAAKQQKVS